MAQQEKPFIIYKSSAGSGKTYTLTLEYLKLALAHQGAFRSILAVTFTNKATQEMKERILEFLERLSHEVKEDEFLDKELMKHLGVGPEELKVRSRDTLLDILHAYGYFSVSTIDSFFQRVIRSFAREMDLQAKFDLELDQDAVLERLVDRVVEKVAEDENLKNWLVEYAEEQIQNGRSWDIRGGIQSLGKEIFQEKFKMHRSSFQSAMDQEDFVKEFKKLLIQEKANLLKEAQSLRQSALEILNMHGLEWKDFSGGAGNTNFVAKLDKLGDKDSPFPDFKATQLAKAGNVENWYTKTSKKKETISAAQPALSDIIWKCQEFSMQWISYQSILQHLNVFGIFRNLLYELRELKDEESILLISDVNDFLKEITKDNDAPFIYEKIGNQYKHFLIDEFQDTSDFQWSSFRPLLENSLASGHTNLIVGDVKQSIYRWRGGKLELLLNEVQKQISEQMIEVKNLSVNFRSLPKVIRFNNMLFEHLPGVLQERMGADYEVDAEGLLEDAFHEVAQEIPSKRKAAPFQGCIHLEFTKKEQKSNDGAEEELENEEDNNVLGKLPQLVMDLQDKGYALRDIAFLVRKKSQGAEIADTLMTYGRENPNSGYSFDVLSEESMFLDRSAAVKSLVALMQYLRSPEDKVSLKTCYFYYALFKGIPYSHELFEKNSIPGELREKMYSLERLQSKWLQLPLLELVEEMVHFLEVVDLGSDLAYVSGFKEAVYDFVKKNRADLSGFLDWWELNKSKRTVKIPEDHDAMRILTIHKSKGLQYKVVLMPFLDWDIVPTGHQAPILWTEFEKGGLRTVTPVTHKQGLLKTFFADLYTNEVKLAYLDSLNMLYVAFTRAEEFIWGHADFKVNKTGVNTKSTGGALFDLLQRGFQNNLEGGDASWDSENGLFTWGTWITSGNKTKEESRKEDLLTWAYTDWKSKLKTKEYAWDFSKAGLEDRSQRKLGVLVHEILEQSNQLQEALSLMQQYAFEGRFDEQVKNEVEQQLKELFATPQLAHWYSGAYASFAEQGILLPGGSHKRPDRILINEQEAIVLDFKTGEKKDADAVQVREYMSLIGKISGKPVKGYLCYLEPTEIVEVYG